MRELIWALQAQADLFEIAEQYAEVAPGFDQEMLERIFDAPLILLEYPFLGETAEALDLRKWTVRRTPFILLYRVSDDAVEIARVIHAASDWKGE